MRSEDSYAALGLRPGAARADVEIAYRRLIKRYHPDRTGGDGSRAAEINRAYTQLTKVLPGPHRRPQLPVRVEPAHRRAKGRGSGLALASLAIAIGAIAFAVQRPVVGFESVDRGASRPWLAAPGPAEPAANAPPLTDFSEPLQARIIDKAIADAISFHQVADMQSTLAYSRSCHDRFRARPSLAWFDACAAFDEATVTLGDHKGLEDSAGFDPTQVIARQMTAARLLSGDMMAADSRLSQIRSRVEMALVPRLDAAARQPPRQP